MPADVAGWKQDAKGVDAMRIEGATQLNSTYRKDKKKIELHLYGGGGAAQLVPFLGWMEIETSEVRSKRITYSGYKGMEWRQFKQNDSAVWLRVGKMIVFVRQNQSDDPAALYAFLDALDLSAVAGTK
jgi:hypothetical protein